MKRLYYIILLVVFSLATIENYAAETLPLGKTDTAYVALNDSTVSSANVKLIADQTSKNNKKTLDAADSVMKSHAKRDWKTWHPDAKKALWLALVIPGGGQIYNRKYWKLPIFYGGFVGCAYALSWNGQMYHDYSQAYMDIMDDDPTTQSYNKFLHLGNTITSDNEDYWKEIFRKRKDRFRRWRDLSVFVMIGVYAVSVIDAYVDASLSDFDISKDLSFHIQPAVINTSRDNGSIKSTGVGLNCSLIF